MSVLAMIRLKPGDEAEHEISLYLIRPDGEEKQIGEGMKGKAAPSVLPGVPGGYNIAAPQVGISPRQMGVHQFKLLLDGEEVARIAFTLAERKAESGN